MRDSLGSNFSTCKRPSCSRSVTVETAFVMKHGQKKTYSSEGISGTLDLYTAMRLDQWLLCMSCFRNPWSTSTAKPALAHAWSSFSPPNLLRMLQRSTEVILAVVPVVHICFAGTTRHGHLEALGWESDTPIRSNATHEHHLLFGHPMPKWAPAHSTAHAPTS